MFGQTLGGRSRGTPSTWARRIRSSRASATRMIVLDPPGPRRAFRHQPRPPRGCASASTAWSRRTGRAFRPDAAAPARRALPGTRGGEPHRAHRRGEPGEMTETVIDLDEVLRGAPGAARRARGGRGAARGATRRRTPGCSPRASAWRRSWTRGTVTAWATSLVDGAPLPGVRVAVDGRAGEAATDADGTARDLPPSPPHRARRAWLVARAGRRRGPPPRPLDAQGNRGAELLWYAATDRNLYRPGEEVRFKGWVRRFERSRTGGLELPRRRADSGRVDGARPARQRDRRRARARADGAGRLRRRASPSPRAPTWATAPSQLRLQAGHGDTTGSLTLPGGGVPPPGVRGGGGRGRGAARGGRERGGVRARRRTSPAAALPGAPVSWTRALRGAPRSPRRGGARGASG